MLSSIFIALVQAVAGDPAPAVTETPAAETSAPAPAATPAPRTERRRVCDSDPAAVGGRLQRRRCRWEEVTVEEPPPEETATEVPNDEQTGGGSNASAAAPVTPQ
jgi:hypothetical protein